MKRFSITVLFITSVLMMSCGPSETHEKQVPSFDSIISRDNTVIEKEFITGLKSLDINGYRLKSYVVTVRDVGACDTTSRLYLKSVSLNHSFYGSYSGSLDKDEIPGFISFMKTYVIRDRLPADNYTETTFTSRSGVEFGICSDPETQEPVFYISVSGQESTIYIKDLSTVPNEIISLLESVMEVMSGQ